METAQSHPYTCLSCQLAFPDAHSQRNHYQQELHRYNARRRVAGLAPLTQELFDDKVKERSTQLPGGGGHNDKDHDHVKKLACKACNKTFASQATHDAHVKTKKHQDAVFKAASKLKAADLTPSAEKSEDASMASPVPSTSTAPPPAPAPAPVVDDEAAFESSGDAALDRLVAKRLQYAPPIAPSSCLFCPHSSTSAQDNVAHMRAAHSFVLPEEEYLVDVEGLLRRLGEEVGTWNVCVCCGKGYGGNIDLNKESDLAQDELKRRASKGIEAVRAHMQSKSHCRLRYDTEEEQLNIADFYDFRPSYPDYELRQQKKAEKRAARLAAKQAKSGGWEDVDDEDEGMAVDGAQGEGEGEGDEVEVVYDDGSDSDDLVSDSDDDDDLPSGTNVTYGDTEYELVLPSGARVGHRAHRTIYKQNLLPYVDGTPFKQPAHASQAEIKPSAQSQALLSLVPAMKKDRTHARPLFSAALVPAKGAGFGKGNGNPGEVIKARNKGEAKEASKATRHFHEHKRFQDQALIRGLRGNSQKYYRDPLLQ